MGITSNRTFSDGGATTAPSYKTDNQNFVQQRAEEAKMLEKQKKEQQKNFRAGLKNQVSQNNSSKKKNTDT